MTAVRLGYQPQLAGFGRVPVLHADDIAPEPRASQSSSHGGVLAFRLVVCGVVFVEHLSLWLDRDVAVDGAGRWLLLVVMASSVVATTGVRVAAVGLAVAVRLLEPALDAWYEVDWIMQLFTLPLCFAPSKRSPAVPFRWLVVLVMSTIYLDSAISKFSQETWQNGSAVWLALTTPHVGGHDLPGWLEHRWIFAGLTWGALVYEALFPLVLVRRFRRVIPVVGLMLHLGIAAALPLRSFGLLMCGPLLFLLLDRDNRPVVEGRALRAAVAYGTVVVVAFCSMLVTGHRPSVIGDLVGVHATGYFPDGKFTTPGPIVRLERLTDDGWVALPSFALDGSPTVSDRWWKVQGWQLRGAIQREAMIRWVASRYCSGCTVRVLERATNPAVLAFDPGAMDKVQSRKWHTADQFDIP